MHPEAYEWVARHATAGPVTVLDLGGRDINGSPRALFPGATAYRVLDIADGPNVDIVADAATWSPNGQRYDVVLATEVFEHCAVWPSVCATAYAALRPGGRFIVTMAGPGRPPHSAVDGGWSLHPGEWYENIEPDRLRAVLAAVGFVEIIIDQQPSPADVRAVAHRPADTTI